MIYETTLDLVRYRDIILSVYVGIDVQQFIFGVVYKPNVNTHDCKHCTITSDIFDIYVGPFVFGIEVGEEKNK